jgi:hypothetical protein
MSQQTGFIHEAETIEGSPLWINLFGPCTLIGRALGLSVDLPDLTTEADTDAVWRLPGNTWKEPFEGLVLDTMPNGDHDWMRLAEYPFGTAFYDLEEGVKFYSTVARLAECLTFIARLADKGVLLCDPVFMGEFGGKSGSCVWVSPAIYGRAPDPEIIFKKIGLVSSRPNDRPPWVMPPGWTLPPEWEELAPTTFADVAQAHISCETHVEH